MDNLSIMRNKSSISMGTSKLYQRDNLLNQNQVKFEQKLVHKNCNCYHCINNTKPISQPIYPRLQSQYEYHKQDNEGYTFIIQRLVDYFGNIKIADSFIAQDLSLVYMSSNRKIKIKSNLPLSQIKKYFDIRRTQYNKIIKNQNYHQITKLQRNTSKLFNSYNDSSKVLKKQSIIIQQNQQSIKNQQQLIKNQQQLIKNQQQSIRKINNIIQSPIKKQKQMKQIALINYKNKFSQIVTQSTLNKYLAKRKNDPFWQQIQSISLIPPYKQQQPTYHHFFYQRTLSNLSEIQSQMERVGKIIDQQDKYADLSSEVVKFNPQNQSFNQLDKSSQVDKKKSLQSQISQQNSPKNIQDSNYLMTKNISLQSSYNAININNSSQNMIQQTIAKLSKQIIAYFQVKLHIRISSCLFKYMIDYENNYYLTGVQKLIAHNLKPNQLRIIHDRYTTIQLKDNQEITELKKQIQQKQWKVLQDQLAQLVADCLQKRKLQLQQVIYKRPSNEILVLIFKRIFPTFNQQDVFTNKNWKNQFPVYIENCRKIINTIINQDQGIRILKRFGITFYRTWNN